MKQFALFYYWYEKLLFKILRIFAFTLLFVFSVQGLINKTYPNFPLFIFSLYLMLEVFVSQKIGKLLPEKEVIINSSNPLDSFTLEALGIFNSNSNSTGIVKALLNLLQVNFILSKTDGVDKEVQILEVDKKVLADKALQLTKEINGKFITTMDLFTAYLLLTEVKSKFLFAKKLKEEDIKNILMWARESYTKEESPKGQDLTFAGEGIAENWVYGWTIETSKYMLDLSKQFLSEKELNPTGRKNEYAQLIEALSRGSSAILVGEEGSGKESAVKELAIQTYAGKLSGNLFHQKIYQLMVDAFMAGAKTQGELEERLNSLIAEVSHSGNVIIYIPEFQNIMGSSSFHLDISGALIPYLKNGSIRMIAAVSPGAFKQYIEPMHSLLDSFSVINFPEPPKTEVLDMLFRKAPEIEAKNNVIITYKAMLSAFDFANKYVKEKVMPGSVVTLLDDCANAVRLAGKKLVIEQDILDQVKKKTNVSVGEPKPVEKTLLLNLEKELHKRIIGQNEAVSALAQSIRRLRAGLSAPKKPISFLFLGPTGVGKTETAKALADIYFGNSQRLVRVDMSEFAGEDGMRRLLGSGPGQGDEKGQLTEPVYDSPYSLVLLDEFEKADQKILDLFLQVLDDGRLTDNKGKTVSFINTIIIATSNAASEFVREQVSKGVTVDKKFQDTLLEFLQTKNIFKPELLNRFDGVIVFKPLVNEEIVQIIKLLIKDVTRTLLEKDIAVTFDEKILAKIALEGFDKNFGARPLRRFIADKIEDPIAQKMLKDEIKRGDKIIVSVDSSNNIVISET